MNTLEAKKIAAKLFENHTVDEFHITADGQGFFTDQSGHNHAQSLEDKKVHKVTREEVKAANLEEETEHILTEEDLLNNPELQEQGLKAGDKINIPAIASKAGKVAPSAPVKPFSKWTNTELTEELTKRGIAIPENFTKKDLVALIEGSEPK